MKKGQAPFPYGPNDKLVCCQCPTGQVLNEDKNGCMPSLAPSPSPSSKAKRTRSLAPASRTRRRGSMSPSSKAKQTGAPSLASKAKPTRSPATTRSPVKKPTRSPTIKPTRSPSGQPTLSPTSKPTSSPSTVVKSVFNPPTPPSKLKEPTALIVVVNGGDSTLSVIDCSSDTVIQTVTLDSISYPHHASVSPDKKKIVIAAPGMDLSNGHSNIMMNMPGMFIVLDATTYSVLKAVELPSMNHNAAFSPDGTEIWTGQMVDDGSVLVYDSTTYALKHTISVGMMPLEVSFSKDELMAFVCLSMSGTVVMIDLKDKSIMQTVTVGTDPVGAWPGSNNLMYVDNETSETITVIDATTMAITGNIDLQFTPGMAAFNAMDSSVWVTDGTNGAVGVFNSAGKKLSSITTGKGAHGIIFNADYTKAYITNQNANTVSIIDTESRMKIKDIAVSSKPNGMIKI